MIQINKLLLVAGIGGARMDFVAGWLGSLPMFLDNNWSINPMTGQSIGNMGFTKCIDSDPTSADSILTHQFTIDPACNMFAVGSMHGRNINHYKKNIDADQIKLLSIDVSKVASSTLIWEFFVKTYLSLNKTLHEYSTKNLWAIDQEFDRNCVVTDHDRVQRLKSKIQLLKNLKHNTNLTVPATIPCTILDYKKMFCTGGSHYLAQQLDISVDQRYHQHWDCVLPMATSPDVLTVLGHTWRKQDYFTD